MMNDNGGSEGSGPKFMGGCPFSARPDSVVCYLNYFVDPADTAVMMLFLRNGDSAIVKDMFIITGNSNGVFERKAFALNYQSSLMPDSLVMGFVTFNPNSNPTVLGSPLNFIIIDDISFTPSSPPVCNGDFESWFDYPYDNLLGWYYLHSVFVDENDLEASNKLVQVINNPPDDYAAELRNVFVDGMFFNPSLSTNPNKDLPGPVHRGFPVSRRYQNVNGYIKFSPDNNDTLSLDMIFYKNGLDIGRAFFLQADTLNEFTPFDIPIIYSDSTLIPDSASFSIRTISRSGPGLSRIWLDKFSFDGLWGTLPGIIVSMPPVLEQAQEIKVYPNPAANTVTLEFADVMHEKTLSIIDLKGNTITATRVPAGQQNLTLDLSGYISGLYFIRGISGSEIFTKKFAIIK